MKKRILAASVIVAFIFSSCVKDNNKCRYPDSTVIASDLEKQSLRDSLSAHGITNALMDTTGFYYTIVNPGTGASVSNLCSSITITYTGGFFNGNLFDSSRIDTTVTPHKQIPITVQLGQLIAGWQKGIKLLKAGGDINLYIPPSLGYGDIPQPDQNGNVVIPANSYLVFKVHVLDIQ
ncbi:MAG: FKBP-type peptidyl-prolyl cis-trans isomerase [Ginsengibacter sp.]